MCGVQFGLAGLQPTDRFCDHLWVLKQIGAHAPLELVLRHLCDGVGSLRLVENAALRSEPDARHCD